MEHETPQPPRRRSARAHRAVLSACGELLAEGGAAQLSFESLAARSGVAKTTLYRWWPSRSALLLEVLGETLTRAGPLPVTDDPRADLRARIEATVWFLTEDPVGSSLPALGMEVLHDPELSTRFRELVRPAREEVGAIMERAVRAGVLPAGSDVAMLIDLYTGATVFRALVNGGPTDAQFVDQLLALILDGRLPSSG